MVTVRILVALFVSSIALTVEAETFESAAFTPYRIDLPLGTPANQVLEKMREQGFEFATAEDAAGFDFGTSKKVAVIQVQGFDLADSVIRVTANMGSALRWSSNDVVLGLREDALSFVHEAAVLPAREARQAFDELLATLGPAYGTEPVGEFPKLLVTDFALLTLGRSEQGIRAVPVAPRETLHANVQYWLNETAGTAVYLLPVFANPTERYLGVTSFFRCVYPSLAPSEAACD